METWVILNPAASAAANSLRSCPTLCDSIDGSPPVSPRPWDSPGKNTGEGCHFLLQCMKVKSERSCSVVSDSLQPQGLQPTRHLRPWDFPGESTGVRCHCLLLLTQLQTLLGFHPFSHQWLYSVSGSSQDYSTVFKVLKILTSLQILT